MFARPLHYISDDVHKLLFPRGVMQSSFLRHSCVLFAYGALLHTHICFIYYLVVW
jgi:hypothetical protein